MMGPQECIYGLFYHGLDLEQTFYETDATIPKLMQLNCHLYI